MTPSPHNRPAATVPRPIRLLALFGLAAACLPVGRAAAAPFPVTSTADSGAGSLRQAIVAANSNPGPDTIPIEVTGTIGLGEPLPVIFDSVSIAGPGYELLEVQRQAEADFSVFVFSAASSSLSGLGVSNGQAELGGGILNVLGSLTLTGVRVWGNEAWVAGGENAVAEGGGILSEGPLTLRETVVVGNVSHAQGGASKTVAVGGGVVALGALTVERSTIAGNVAEAVGGEGTALAQGGGLLAAEPATIALSTISGNAAVAEEAPTERAEGGGLEVDEATLTGSTLTGNLVAAEEEAFGANLDAFDETVVRSTILAKPQGDAGSCGGLGISSGGFNLDEDGSCGFGQGTDLTGAAGLDPVLRPNGGPTLTHALLEGSAAIDRGSSFGSAVDQRGLPRPSDFPAIGNAEGGDGSDIGAFELQVPAPSPVLVTAVPADTQAPNTRIVKGPPRVTFKRVARFWFNATEPQSSFQCKLDGRRWRGCRSPHKRKVGAGAKHVFKVRAIDRFGNVDPSPARFGWRVKRIEA